ncbi:MAG: alpha/beta hydrolase [Candidatus Thorarchaeota archaeon]
MDRQPLYFTIFILSILICSSFYLSWAADRGLGDVSVTRVSVESAPGRSVELLIYSPRSVNHYEPMPVILTIHGLTGSKEGMFPFNIELARRNFTVVSIDLPGHGDSIVQFDITDFTQMAQDAYAALRYVQTTFTSVDNESYGVLSHSLGFRVAIELEDFPISPKAYAAVGDVGKLAQDEFIEFPRNLLLAVGVLDEIVSHQDALQAIRVATGNESAIAGVTYGSLDNKTAYRLSFGLSNHASEIVDSTLVNETVSWLVQGVQGESQILYTKAPSEQVYSNENVASVSGSFFILISVIPVMWLVYSFLPERLKPRQISNKNHTYSFRKTFGISSVLGAGMVIIFIASSLLGLYLEDLGIDWLNLMSGTGLILFLIFAVVAMVLLMVLLMGSNNTNKVLSTGGVEVSIGIKEQVADILKSLIIAGFGISWILFWLTLANSVEPGVLLLLIKLPLGIRSIDTAILTIIAIPFFLVEASWIRWLLSIKMNQSEIFERIRQIGLLLISRFAMVGVLTVLVIIGTSAAGVSLGRIVLLGVIWVRIIIVQLISTLILTWASLKFENTWSAVMVVSFIFSLVLVATLPII